MPQLIEISDDNLPKGVPGPIMIATKHVVAIEPIDSAMRAADYPGEDRELCRVLMTGSSIAVVGDLDDVAALLGFES